MTHLDEALEGYQEEAIRLATTATTTEESYYGPIRDLLIGVLERLELPTDVRTGTSEDRATGGTDRPDVALYDSEGDFALVCGEVKLPDASLEQMAVSTDRNNQIGRYLAQTGAVLLCNVRAFGLLVPDSEWDGEGPVPADERQLLTTATLWPNTQSLQDGRDIEAGAGSKLSELVEETVTSFAPIAEPETLARVLALQARRAKEELPSQFGDAVQALIDDFGEALGIKFEGQEGEAFFRSSLVQTVFYGLFAGWLLWAQDETDEPFRWQQIPEYLSIPFIGGLFYELQHPKRISELGLAPRLDLATDTLGRVDHDRFFRKLSIPSLGGDDTDPERAAASAIVYFYEPFLAAFDPSLRKELGVWYTPPEIVKYQVRRVDQLLRQELDCERGLADDRVVVLDPGCGTGAYLIEVLTCIAEQLRSEGVEAELGATLLNAVQERVLGFEILTAPFVIAHLQIHLILSGLGAKPDSDQRPGVYLTNALTGWEDEERPDLHFPELAEEHDLAHRVKQEVPIIVVLGNPPYNRFAGAPIEEERELVDHYKGITRDENGRQKGNTELYSRFGIRKHLLDDLYIRFFRLAEIRIGREAEHGVVSLISNSSYLTGRSHPIMRESLIHSFDSMWIDNLNGDKYRTGKIIPDGEPGAGSSDQSIFVGPNNPGGIQVGVAINTLLKDRDSTRDEAKLKYRDFWGQAHAKREALVESLELDEWSERKIDEAAEQPAGPRPYESFETSEDQDWKLVPYEAQEGYEDWYALDEMFPVSFQGVNPNRGLTGSVIAMQREDLENRMRDYFSEELSFGELEEMYPELCKSRARYHPSTTRSILRQQDGYDDDKVVPYLLFPLDRRFLYYETRHKLLNESRPGLKANLDDPNTFLLGVPQPRRESESIPLFTSTAFDLHVHDRGTVGFPARIYHEPQQSELFEEQEDLPRANLSPEFWERVQATWDVEGELHDDAALAVADDLVKVCLALGHSPQYQEDHRGSLAHDWARIPVPAERDVFEEVSRVGGQVATLLDPTSYARSVLHDVLGQPLTRQLAVVEDVEGGTIGEDDLVVEISYFGSATGRWQARDWDESEDHVEALGASTGDLYLNDSVRLSNVPEAVWELELGGYPVISKWLGYRHERYRDGNPLSLSEKDALREIVQRLAGLVALHPTLNDLYERATANPWRVPEE